MKIERMSHYLALAVDELEATNSYWTAREISQQPRVWRETHGAIEANRATIDSWLSPLLSQPQLRIVLAGAGTSAFIGETLAPWLRKRLKRRVEAISTTDIVGNPEQYLAEDIPTLLISFARSGDSPESVASVELASHILSDCHHLVLTCNPQGSLVLSAVGNDRMFCQFMPADTNDRGFAMTSSYSSMLVACATIFIPEALQLEQAADLAQAILDSRLGEIQGLAQQDIERLVVLGAGCLRGTAQEAALKCLELSAGEVVPLADSPLGFRHGPKSVVNSRTLIIQLQSSDPLTRQYDSDLWDELAADKQTPHLVQLSAQKLGVESGALDDVWLSLPYIVYCQLFAFYKALAIGITADNPCPSGEVNRVVKGVSIYGLNGH